MNKHLIPLDILNLLQLNWKIPIQNQKYRTKIMEYIVCWRIGLIEKLEL